MNESDLRSNVHYLGSSENKAWKKFRPVGIWTHEMNEYSNKLKYKQAWSNKTNKKET